jgi:hypothetical protein
MNLDKFRPESEKLPNDVDETLEDEIDERIQRKDWQRKGQQRKVVVMVADRALDMNTDDPMAARRFDAQEQVADELGYEHYQSVQDLCGRQLFKEEYVPLNEWQRAFTQLLDDIERDRFQEGR